MNQVNIPILVFSAGLGDSVEAVLRHCEVLLPNVEVSNISYFDDNPNKIKGAYYIATIIIIIIYIPKTQMQKEFWPSSF